MEVSKAWDWVKGINQRWLIPSEESYYISDKWKSQNFSKLLDFGCGLGRNSIYFAQQGFKVYAFDLSDKGTNYLRGWAEKENLSIDIKVADMLFLPYSDNEFDCLFAYHVISHTDTAGAHRIFKEINRILKPNGEIYLTLCSKDTWAFAEANYPKIDENTIIKTEDGPEKDVPHFYCNLDDIFNLLKSASLEAIYINHVDNCYYEGQVQNRKGYFKEKTNV